MYMLIADVEKEAVIVNPNPNCFKACDATYGDYECNIDCIYKQIGDGRCRLKQGPSGAQKLCCCNPS